MNEKRSKNDLKSTDAEVFGRLHCFELAGRIESYMTFQRDYRRRSLDEDSNYSVSFEVIKKERVLKLIK